MIRHIPMIDFCTVLRTMLIAGVIAVLLACAGAAVGAAIEGDSIEVWGGSYHENVDEESASFNNLKEMVILLPIIRYVVTTQVPKPLSGDFTIQKLSGTWSILQPTGNLTAECAEGRRGKING